MSGIAGVRDNHTGAIQPRKAIYQTDDLDDAPTPEAKEKDESKTGEKQPDDTSKLKDDEKESIFHPEEIPKEAPEANPIAAALSRKDKGDEEIDSTDNFRGGDDMLLDEELEDDENSKPSLGSESANTSTKGGSFANLFEKSGTDLEEVEKNRPLDPSRMPANYVPPGKKPSGGVQKRPVRCFECNYRQQVSIAATSTQCGRCSVYISLADKVIDGPYSSNIRTRGDVTIHKKGSLIGCDIACHNLTVQGKISGSVDCSGDAFFKNSGKVMGSMHCKHLFIDKKCELTFPQGIVAETADIHGTVHGNIICSGTIKIMKTGSVLGDAKAKAVVLKDGGVLTGQMSIQSDIEIELPHKKRYLDVHDYDPPHGKV